MQSGDRAKVANMQMNPKKYARLQFNCSRRCCKIRLESLKFVAIFLLLYTAASSWPTAETAKILGLFAHPSESNFAVMRTVMTELARREHNITVISSHRLNEDIENLQEIIVEPEFPFWSKLQTAAGVQNGLQELSRISDSSLQHALAVVGAAATDYFLSHERVQHFIHMPASDFDYDLIIVDLFYTEALLVFGEVFNKPTIAVISSNFEHYMTRWLESFVPVACSPIDFAQSSYRADAAFWSRLSNVRQCMTRRRQFVHGNMATQQKLIKKFFSHHKESLPTVSGLQARLSMLLVNNHVPLARPRPLLPNTIAVGGLHIRRPRELPWHLKRFLDEARPGVIYVNLGNELLCKEIPKVTLATLFSVFGRRKERIVWSCHDAERLDGMPKNIMLQHMVPQTDILAHPRVKLFVMNGDLLGLQEGLVRHVPMLGIPIFREEHENMDHAMTLGVGLKLDYANLSETSLSWALQTVLQDSASYELTIREVAAVFRNRPLGALETTMYWVDYVLRYRGAPYIRSPGIDIASNHLHLSDLFIYYFVITLVIVGLLMGFVFLAYHFWRRYQIRKIYSKLR